MQHWNLDLQARFKANTEQLRAKPVFKSTRESQAGLQAPRISPPDGEILKLKHSKEATEDSLKSSPDGGRVPALATFFGIESPRGGKDLRRPSSPVLAFQFLDDDQGQHTAWRNESTDCKVFVLTIMVSGTSFAGFKLSYPLGIREPASLTIAPPSQRSGQSQDTIIDINTPTSMRRRRRREARNSQSEIESFTSSDPESELSREESADEEIALPNCVLFLVEALVQSRSSLCNVVTAAAAPVARPLKATAKAISQSWQAFREWWLPLRYAPSPDPIQLAVILARRRRPMHNEPIQATAGSQIAISGRQPLSVRRPKSLQHARQWRDMGKPTSHQEKPYFPRGALRLPGIPRGIQSASGQPGHQSPWESPGTKSLAGLRSGMPWGCPGGL
ncbi:hypothetical protein NMY22_g5384 [Coprinellus aureogranulatus]|nr:hypothetical protein NMY22_g5384 [Coprinellus aureogranulatus]